MLKLHIIGGATALAAVLVTTLAWSDSERDQERQWGALGSGIAPVHNETYQTECGACHLAYPPALLPADGWQRVMGSLGDHFGDDATLDPATTAEIAAYLSAGAADVSAGVRAHGFAANPPPSDGPPRITETRYFRSQHYEIPDRLVVDNSQVGSFSACQACHSRAEQGRFDEDEVRIPGAGAWED